MRMCDRGVQMLITTVGAFAAFSLMTIAVGTDYWLYSRGVCRTKSTNDNDTSRKNEEVMTHSGLWRTCCLEGTDRPADPHLPPPRPPRPRGGGPAQKFGGGQGHPGTPHLRAGPPASPGTRGRRAEHPIPPGRGCPPPPAALPSAGTDTALCCGTAAGEGETSRVGAARRTRGPGGAGPRVGPRGVGVRVPPSPCPGTGAVRGQPL